MFNLRDSGTHLNDSVRGCPGSGRIPPRLRCFGRATVELNGNQVGNFERVLRFAYDVLEIPDAWAAPATVSRCGRIKISTSPLRASRGSGSHCEFSSSWEGDTSSPVSPDTGLESLRKYRVGRYPDRYFSLKASPRYFLLITWWTVGPPTQADTVGHVTQTRFPCFSSYLVFMVDGVRRSGK